MLRGGETPVSLPAGAWRAIYLERGAAALSAEDTSPVRLQADTGHAIDRAAVTLAPLTDRTRFWLWQWRFAGDAPFPETPGLAACLSHEIHAAAGIAADPPHAAILRMERVDLSAGAVTPAHTHAGCGLRVLVGGRINATVGDRQLRLCPGDCWLERGPGECVVGRVGPEEPAAFVRLMVLPVGLAGKNSYRPWDERAAAMPRPAAYRLEFEKRVQK